MIKGTEFVSASLPPNLLFLNDIGRRICLCAFTTPPVCVPFLLFSFEKMEENKKLSANREAVWTEKFIIEVLEEFLLSFFLLILWSLKMKLQEEFLLSFFF